MRLSTYNSFITRFSVSAATQLEHGDIELIQMCATVYTDGEVEWPKQRRHVIGARHSRYPAPPAVARGGSARIWSWISGSSMPRGARSASIRTRKQSIAHSISWRSVV